MIGRRRDDGRGASAAFAVGVALGVVAAGGTALLLYTGQGFLRAAGLLVSSTVMAVAAGLWAGAPEGRTVSRRGRWAALTIGLFAAGLFTLYWNAAPGVRTLAIAGALAVLLLLALPAYAAGSLMAALHSRDAGTGTAAGATAGAALGLLAATSFLIQALEPAALYFAATAVCAGAAIIDVRRAGTENRQNGDDMTGHVTLITGVGGAGQLGATLVRRFLDAGATVIATGRSDMVQRTVAEVGGGASAVIADLLDDDDVARLIDHVRTQHGRLDSVINAAGGLTAIGAVADTEPGTWSAEHERNALTALRVTRAALPLLRESRGAIVNFASPAAESAPARLSAYSAAKAAVVALTRSTALEEAAHGVRANAIAPGMMDTAQNLESAGADAKFVSRDEVAEVVMFLAGEASRGVNGQVIHVPGATLT